MQKRRTNIQKSHIQLLSTKQGTKLKIITILLAVMLILPIGSLPAAGVEIQAYQNPSLEETARKLEIAARSKGIPSAILKTIAFVESGWRQFDKNGNVVTNPYGARPGLGIMQITSYDDTDEELVNKLKYDIDFNIAFGADLLNAKWNMVPQIGDGDRNKLENWYFALWAYNSWSTRNNPNNAALDGKVAYQEAVIRKAATEYYPRVVTPVQITPISAELLPEGTVPKKGQTWETPQPYTLGDLKDGIGDDPSRGESQGTVQRIAGRDRLDTVNQIALTGWPSGAETVIITRSDDFPDALAGVSLANKFRAPILLTSSKELDEEVIQVLTTLKPLKAIILGGEAAISNAVEMKLRETLAWTDNIQRIAGKDRFETAAMIAKDFPKENGVALATGNNFPDALSLASAAAGRGIPILLTTQDTLPAVTKNMLQELLPRELYIAGGEAVISSKIVDALAQCSGIACQNIIRFAGSDRYETAVKVAETFYPKAEDIYMATGQDFADPLAAGALAANRNAPLLLVSAQGFDIDSPTENYVKKMPLSTNVKIIGGEGNIPEKTVTQVKYLLNQI